ncbi:hypothetical protein AcV5_003616 [Taiwanofungus camphoratus]|nr:hypothetical protein AcV5_003616 [Antrodia cinnamomea]
MPPTATTQDQDSDKSGDEATTGERAAGTTAQNTKRSVRACDRCRKSKSKCEPGPSGNDRCRSCLAAGTVCAFSGPSFRRGPPKGYIQALEHRLHQMESVLAAIMSSKDARAMGIVTDLRKDDLARNILDRVDSGPFGPSGRKQRSIDPTQDNFFASIVSAVPPKQTSDRSRRQSRVAREGVTQQDPSVLARPTLEWQDRLSEALLLLSSRVSAAAASSGARPMLRSPDGGTPDSDVTSEPKRQRRRLDNTPAPSDPQWDELHVMEDTDQDALDDTANAFGNLSIDENREVRYHGNSSGLYLLARDERWDKRNLGGIWNFPMAKHWPGVPSHTPRSVREQVEEEVRLPPVAEQDRLIQLYFTYVNPPFPVIDKESFMAEYNAQKHSGFLGCTSSQERNDNPPDAVRPERMQKISKLLLFAIFAFAARYADVDLHHAPPGDARQWIAGSDYAYHARRILDTTYQESRTSTCQALILLGVREFGIGSLEEGWLHVGMALRMAVDLGLNRNAENWQHNGDVLFTPSENNIRRRIWWATCLADKFSALFLGRPMGIHEADFSTPLPEVPENDDEEIWQPGHLNPQGSPIAPLPGRFQSCFREAASLSVITGDIVEKIYPVTKVSNTPRRVLMEQIHARLTQWYINLPGPLQHSSTSSRPCPPPHVLLLHCQYWFTVLLLHRPFVPKQVRPFANPVSRPKEPDPVPWRSFDICQGAACHISAFVNLFRKNFDLRWGPAFLCPCLQSAGIMHIITLRHRPSDAQATLGLRDCISACDQLQAAWPSAARVGDILRGAKIHLDIVLSNPRPAPHKRLADDAFGGQDNLPIHLEPERAYAEVGSHSEPSSTQIPLPDSHFLPSHPVQSQQVPADLHGSMLADYFGAEAPVMEPQPPVEVGYDWWPTLSENVPASVPHSHADYSYLQMPSQPFTFSQQQFSPDFVQGMRDPVLHFPSPSSHYPNH